MPTPTQSPEAQFAAAMAAMPQAAPVSADVLARREAARKADFRRQMAAAEAQRVMAARRYEAGKAKAVADRAQALAKVSASVARWIAEARDHEDGAGLLRNRAEWIGGQMQRLAAGARQDCVPNALKGLTAADLIAAHGELLSAARSHVAQKAA